MKTAGRGTEGLMMIVPLCLFALFIVYVNGGTTSLLETMDTALRGFFAFVVETLAGVFR
jgi:hypothetical protein